MTEIGHSGRDPRDALPNGGGTGAELGTGARAAPERDRRAGPESERRLAERAAMAERARAFGARLSALTEPRAGDRATDAAGLLALAEWRGGAPLDAAPAAAAPAAGAAAAARGESLAETVAARVERALAGELARRAGDPIGLSIVLDRSVLGLGRIDVTVTPTGIDLVFVRAAAGAAAADLAGPAADLAQRLARRFEGRRIAVREVVEAEAADATGGGLAAIAAILGGTGSAR